MAYRKQPTTAQEYLELSHRQREVMNAASDYAAGWADGKIGQPGFLVEKRLVEAVNRLEGRTTTPGWEVVPGSIGSQLAWAVRDVNRGTCVAWAVLESEAQALVNKLNGVDA
jgi:hypothetical protein